MNNSIKLCGILLLILLNFVLESNAQQVAISGNSRFTAITAYNGRDKDTLVIEKKGKTKTREINFHSFTTSIYEFYTNKKIQEIHYRSKRKQAIDETGFSHAGKLFYARSGEHWMIWDIKSGRLVIELYDVDAIGFANYGNFFVVARQGEFVSYDAYTGDRNFEYRVSRSTRIEKIMIPPNDNHIVAKTKDGRFYIWDVNKERTQKRLRGNEIHFGLKNNFYVLRQSNSRIYIYDYSFQNYKRLHYFNSYRIVRDIEDDYHLKKTPELVLYKSSLSPKGKYIALYCKETDSEVVYFFDTFRECVVAEARDPKGEMVYPYDWVKDDLVAFYDDNYLNAAMFNVATNRSPLTMNYIFDIERNGMMNLGKALRKRYISPDWRYAIFQDYKFGKSLLRLRSGAISESPIIAYGVDFVKFTPNSRYALVKSNTKGYGYVLTSDVESQLDPNDSLQVYYFQDSLSAITPETMIIDDAIPPVGYEYNKIKDFKHISEVPEEELVKLYLKTVDIDDSTSSLQVHLLDKDGNYYYGASDPQYLSVWCNLLLRSPSKKMQKIDDFIVEEYRSTDELPSAVVLIMDHSGSMGSARALALQYGAGSFIEQKDPDDAIAIIKFDSNIGVEVPLSPNKKRLLTELKKDGLGIYGGATSLLDAIHRGVEILKHAEGYNRKSIVILTDGNENSSYLSRPIVIHDARFNEVNVFTVGFGDYISEEYLKSLAYYTEGSYYHIYSTGNFRWIFKDIYQRIRNYYSIKFKTDTIGTYTALLEICLDDIRKDSLITVFNNEPVDFSKFVDNDEYKDSIITPPLEEVKITEIEMDDFKEFADSIKLVEQRKIEKEIQEDFSRIEFPDIQFVFDETKIIPGTEKGINQVIAFLKEYPKVKIEIRGHTDNIGTNEKNLILSRARAQKVKQILIDNGINAERILSSGYGEEKPLTDNATEKGRAKNRRVEFLIVE